MPIGRHDLEIVRGDKTDTARVTLAAGAGSAAKLVPARTVTARDGAPDNGPSVTDGSGFGAAQITQLAIGVGGLGLVGVGVWMMLDAQSLRSDIEDLPIDEKGITSGMTEIEAHTARTDADNKSTVGIAIVGVGAAAGVSALVWGRVGAGSEGPTPPPVSVTPRADGFAIGGRF